MLAIDPSQPPDLIDLLLGEHALILTAFRDIERLLEVMSLQRMLGVGAVIESLLKAHALEEDSLLCHTIPTQRVGIQQVQAAMDAEHHELRRHMEELGKARTAHAARRILRQAIELTREHFAVEERVLFRLARQAMNVERLRELGAIYAAKRGLDVTG